MDTRDSIGHYRLGEKLGQGGMGEVYRATDTRLGRDVAIKRITPALAKDAVRMANLTREAQVLASLNHPNIASIYGIEDEAIVMELVEGPTLAERLEQGGERCRLRGLRAGRRRREQQHRDDGGATRTHLERPPV